MVALGKVLEALRAVRLGAVEACVLAKVAVALVGTLPAEAVERLLCLVELLVEASLTPLVGLVGLVEQIQAELYINVLASHVAAVVL